ncbi:MAG: nitric-oxide reductase large subunit, partial [Caldithrix sp.]|nr:nitric-oxide reductase large subunit [Caldithrix sp.]
MNYRRLWIGLAVVIVASFLVLGYYGTQIYRVKPPIPDKVVTSNGNVLFSGQDIKDGQNVWQSMGGQEVGSIWGHGSYVAPDWTADWLHRESMFMLNHWAEHDYDQTYEQLDSEKKALLQARLQNEMRTNTYHEETNEVVISPLRAQAIRHVSQHYTGLF